MKIIDIKYADLEVFYATLAEKLSSEVSKTSHIAIIGIATSGLKLSAGVHKELMKLGYSNAKDYGVRCKRPHSKMTDVAGKIYKSPIQIPTFISNMLRKIEHVVLYKLRPTARIVDFNNSENEIATSECILIVDDAIDSGHSMKSVFEKTKALAPKAGIKLAAYVITQKNPVIEPHYYQHRDVIVRFPWAADSKVS